MLSYSGLNYLKTLFRSKPVSNNYLMVLRCCSTDLQPKSEYSYKDTCQNREPVVETKLLKIAIVGTPNAGKSTLINQIVNRRVFAISKKVHTTVCRARAVHVEGKTQLVFLDTPGLVTINESQKYKLGHQFMSDGEYAIEEADVIGVIQDLSNSHTRNKLDNKVLRLLNLYPNKESFLVLNKIDTLKSKRNLLDLSSELTGGKLRNYKEPLVTKPPSEKSVQETIKEKPYWEHFSDVFMVSALLGNGTSDLKKYLLNSAHSGEWLFDHSVFTDQKPVQIIEETVRSKLLDYLPNEVPYNLGIELEYLDFNHEDRITAVVLISCKTPRIERLVMGSGGRKIKLIAKEAEQALMDTFLSEVHLRLVLTDKPSTNPGTHN